MIFSGNAENNLAPPELPAIVQAVCQPRAQQFCGARG